MLLDLVLTVTLLAILSAVAVRMAGDDDAVLEMAARRVAADMVQAQQLALEARTSFGLRVDPSTHAATFVFADDTTPADNEAALRAAGTFTAGEIERLLAARPRGEVGYGGVRVVTSDFAGRTRVVFRADGTPANGGHVELRHGGSARRVYAQAATGRVTITVP